MVPGDAPCVPDCGVWGAVWPGAPAAAATVGSVVVGTGTGGPGKIACTGRRLTAALMNPRHRSTGAVPPVILAMGVSSSRPIHTTVVRPPVNPQNQASL